MESSIRAVFLDAGNTLIHTPLKRGERLARCLGARGYSIEVTRAARAASDAQHELLLSQQRWIGTPDEEAAFWAQYWPRILTLLELEDPHGELAQCLDGEVKFVGFLQPYPDVRRALVALKGRYRMGLISNAFPSLREVLDDLDLSRFFDSITISAFARVAKPEPDIFQQALDSLGVHSRESVFVDDLPENVAAAEQMGFQVFLMDRDGLHAETPYPRLTDLMQLVEKLAETD